MLYIVTFTGITTQLERALRKRHIDFCALKETRWCGAKCCDIERERGRIGYKFLFFGTAFTQHGADIAISEGYCDAIKEVERL